MGCSRLSSPTNLTTNLFETSPLYSSAFPPPASISPFRHHHPISRQPASLGSASQLTLRFPHPVATPCAVPRKRLPTFMPRLVLRRPPFPPCASNFPLIYMGSCASSPQRCKTTALKPSDQIIGASRKFMSPSFCNLSQRQVQTPKYMKEPHKYVTDRLPVIPKLGAVAFSLCFAAAAPLLHF